MNFVTGKPDGMGKPSGMGKPIPYNLLIVYDDFLIIL
jgi:hypothetical protein